MIEIYCDGGASPNPGFGGVGFVIYKKGILLLEAYQYIGKVTNNQAEFTAAINALSYALKFFDKEVTIHTDSQLVYGSTLKVGQDGYKHITSKNLVYFHRVLLDIIGMFDSVEFKWISRDVNGLADKLSKRARSLKNSRVLQYGRG